jgi:hypothetical protein
MWSGKSRRKPGACTEFAARRRSGRLRILPAGPAAVMGKIAQNALPFALNASI